MGGPHGPDVTLLLPPTARVEAAFVEVKGPRDTLSEKQHVWLRILSTAGVRAGLCKVVEPPAAGKKKAAAAAAAAAGGKGGSVAKGGTGGKTGGRGGKR
jgi:hypothetical protein